MDECTFDKRQMEVTMHYSFEPQVAIREHVEFSFTGFNNPITDHKEGFKLEALDDDKYTVAYSGEVTLTGVSDATQFESVDFSYVDKANSG